MVKRFRKTRIWLNTILLLISIALWLFLAPQQIGGQVAYILIRGISMEPNFYQNDLVIVRRAQTYDVGQVVAFQHEGIGTVLHRIIERDAERFILQGDNNAFPDSYLPDSSEIIGVEWFHLPAVGHTMQRIRETPASLAFFVGIIVFIGFYSVGAPPSVIEDGIGVAKEGTAVSYYRIQQREEWLSLIVFLTIAFAIAAWFVHNKPLETGSFNHLDYTQQINFSYSAVAEGDVYDAKIVTSGEPIFRQLSDSVTLRIRYRLLAEQLDDLSGDYQLHAELRDNHGWKRTFELLPSTPFETDTLDMAANISLSELQSIIEQVQAQTGVERSFYQLRILPVLAVKGHVAGEPFVDNYSAELRFELNELEMRAVLDSGKEQGGLQQSDVGAIQRPIRVPNTIALLTFNFSVEKLRQVTLIASGIGMLAIVGLLADLWRLRRPLNRDARATPQHELVISAESDPLALSETHIPLHSFEDLVRVAQHSGQVILQHRDRSAVYTGQVLYHFEHDLTAAETVDVIEPGTREALA